MRGGLRLILFAAVLLGGATGARTEEYPRSPDAAARAEAAARGEESATRREPRVRGVRLENTRTSKADIRIQGADGGDLATARLRGRESREVRVDGAPDRVRVTVARTPADDRAAAALAGVLLGDAARRADANATGSGVHYHDGQACSDPNCAPSGSDSGDGNDAARGVLGAAIAAARDRPAAEANTASDVFVCAGGHRGGEVNGVKVSLRTEVVSVDLPPPPPARACPDRDWRWKPGGASRDCAFDAPREPTPRIRIEPEIARGEHVPEGMRRSLADMADLLSKISTLKTLMTAYGNAARGGGVSGADAVSLWGNVVGDQVGLEIPTGPEELASAFAVNSLRLGQRMVTAADRWASRNARKVVTLTAEVDLERVSFSCGEIEVCRQGRWIYGGWWPKARPRATPLRTLRFEVRDILIGEGPRGRRELDRAAAQVEGWLRRIRFAEMAATRERLEESEDPCSACPTAAPATTTHADGDPPAADCERLRRALREAEGRLAVSRDAKTDYERSRDAAEAAQRTNETECRDKISAAGRDLEDARTAWREASGDLHSLVRSDIARGDARFRSAERAERAAKTRRDEAQRALERLRADCDARAKELEEEIALARAGISRLSDTIREQEREVERARRELDACRRRGR